MNESHYTLVRCQQNQKRSLNEAYHLEKYGGQRMVDML
jgi:hypothetical protein